MPGQWVQCRDRVFSKFSSERKEGTGKFVRMNSSQGRNIFLPRLG